MTFYDPTLYGRDDEEEFGDSGAYSESLEEDFEEEEEEEEEAGVPEPDMSEPAAPAPPPPPAPRPAAPGGGTEEARCQEEGAGQESARQEKSASETGEEEKREKSPLRRSLRRKRPRKPRRKRPKRGVDKELAAELQDRGREPRSFLAWLSFSQPRKSRTSIRITSFLRQPSCTSRITPASGLRIRLAWTPSPCLESPRQTRSFARILWSLQQISSDQARCPRRGAR